MRMSRAKKLIKEIKKNFQNTDVFLALERVELAVIFSFFRKNCDFSTNPILTLKRR